MGRATDLEIVLERRIFGAGEAMQKGLVNRIVPDDQLTDEVNAIVMRIAEGALLVARWHKKFLKRLAEPRMLDVSEIEDKLWLL